MVQYSVADASKPGSPLIFTIHYLVVNTKKVNLPPAKIHGEEDFTPEIISEMELQMSAYEWEDSELHEIYTDVEPRPFVDYRAHVEYLEIVVNNYFDELLAD